ncbi:putative NADH dehydrogenase [ubiquinone] 1 alpha subcomplex subunit 13-B-like [Capsicum annuum]|nr:putative NADH dehydrogenase [ubiquinone] 1 alpha subcomplex subunit 13-B-like [Capsicum annuum]
MTETRTCEFDHNNNPKKSTGDEELKDGSSGLCCYGEKNGKGGILKDEFSGLLSTGDEVGLSGLCCYGEKDVKGGILEAGFSGLCSDGAEDDKDGVLRDGLSGLCSNDVKGGVLKESLSGLCSYGAEDDKGGILKDGLSGFCSYGAEGDKGGILEGGCSELPSSGDEDRCSVLPSSVDEDGLPVVSCDGDEDDLSVVSCYGDEDDKGGILEHGFSGLPCSRDENGLSGLCNHGEKDVKGGILEKWLSGWGLYGDKDGKGGILKDEFPRLYSSEDEDGSSELCSYGDEEAKGVTLEDWLSGIGWYADDDFKLGMLEEEGKKKLRYCGTVDWLRRDPLAVLGSDIMLIILSRLDARSVALCLLVSCGWRALASTDMIWSSKCEELWQGKTHLPRIAKVNRLSKLALYSLSIMDGKRKRIRREDLHDHVWEFHFTEAAPQYWRMLDPYWTGTGPPLRRYFLPDGSHTAEPDDQIWGGHESCYTIVTGMLADGKIRDHYVRINRWPQMYVTRKEDWSWEVSNDLCVYKSVPDSDKEDGTGPLL